MVEEIRGFRETKRRGQWQPKFPFREEKEIRFFLCGKASF
jgi:hypothetical protein